MTREEFLMAAVPHFPALKSYIKRRLRVAYLTFEIHQGPYTSDDIFEDLIIRAYETYDQKLKIFSQREWLYLLANEMLEHYFHEQEREERRWSRHEDMRTKEQAGLRERISTRARGEPWLLEEVDDFDYRAVAFAPQHLVNSENFENDAVDRKDEVVRIARALSRVPYKERVAFELFAFEGFNKNEVGNILDIDPREVPRVAQWVKERVFQELYQKLYTGTGVRR